MWSMPWGPGVPQYAHGSAARCSISSARSRAAVRCAASTTDLRVLVSAHSGQLRRPIHPCSHGCPYLSRLASAWQSGEQYRALLLSCQRWPVNVVPQWAQSIGTSLARYRLRSAALRQRVVQYRRLPGVSSVPHSAQVPSATSTSSSGWPRPGLLAQRRGTLVFGPLSLRPPIGGSNQRDGPLLLAANGVRGRALGGFRSRALVRRAALCRLGGARRWPVRCSLRAIGRWGRRRGTVAWWCASGCRTRAVRLMV
jgi:hypothetical protein